MISEPRRVHGALVIALLIVGCTSDGLRRRYLRDQSEFLPPPANPVIIIPGFGNTRLYDPVVRRFVWGTPRSMFHRQYPDDIDLPIDATTFDVGRDRLVPRGFVGSRGFLNTGYQLRRALEAYAGYRGNVFVFEYDWRQSSLDSARELNTLLDARGAGTIDLVTHSAGAIVALSFVRQHPDRVRRLVFIAPPLEGTLEAFRVLARGERIVRRDITPAMAATFPFLFELLPPEPFLIDERGQPIAVDWQRFRPHDESRGRAFDRLLRTKRERIAPAENVSIIAGDCVATPRWALLRGDGSLAFYPDELRPGEQHLRDLMFEPGDGSISISTALSSGAPHQLFCDGHHGIASDPSVHRAVIRILTAP